jgi:YtcA family
MPRPRLPTEAAAGKREMTRGFQIPAVALMTLPTSALSGCGVRGAPSFDLFGAYFPGWMFCAFVGLAAAIIVRVLFVASGLASVLPLQLFVCSAIGLCCGLASWLLWFGH